MRPEYMRAKKTKTRSWLKRRNLRTDREKLQVLRLRYILLSKKQNLKPVKPKWPVQSIIAPLGCLNSKSRNDLKKSAILPLCWKFRRGRSRLNRQERISISQNLAKNQSLSHLSTSQRRTLSNWNPKRKQNACRRLKKWKSNRRQKAKPSNKFRKSFKK